MPRCAEKTAKGTQCKKKAIGQGPFCCIHVKADKTDNAFKTENADPETQTSPKALAANNMLMEFTPVTQFEVMQIKEEIKRLKRQLKRIEDPHAEAKKVFFQQHKHDPDVVEELRNRLRHVNLYTTDKAMPRQQLKMLTDWKYDVVVANGLVPVPPIQGPDLI